MFCLTCSYTLNIGWKSTTSIDFFSLRCSPYFCVRGCLDCGIIICSCNNNCPHSIWPQAWQHYIYGPSTPPSLSSPKKSPAPTLNLEQQQINYYKPINYFPYNFCVDRTLAGGTSKLTSQHLDKRTSTAFCAFLVNWPCIAWTSLVVSAWSLAEASPPDPPF